MQLNIFKETAGRLPREKINRLAELVFKSELKRKNRGIVNLVFVSDKQMKKMNSDYRNKNKTTDVLSFNIDEAGSDEVLFGEVYISYGQAKSQAESYDATVTDEIIRLCCHGFLHLLGYDHMKKSDNVLMKKKEDYFLKRI